MPKDFISSADRVMTLEEKVLLEKQLEKMIKTSWILIAITFAVFVFYIFAYFNSMGDLYV